MLQLIEAEKKLYPQLTRPTILPSEVGKIGGLVSEYSTKTSSTALLSPARTGYDFDDASGSGLGLGLGVGVGSSPMGARNGSSQHQYKGLLNELVNTHCVHIPLLLFLSTPLLILSFSSSHPPLTPSNHTLM